MPSFDTVSRIDEHELTNALDQANREITNRYDFKGADARIDQTDTGLVLEAQNEFQVKQMQDILFGRAVKRGIDLKAFDAGEIVETNNRARQPVQLRQGISQETARKIVKLVKDSKLKVQAAIQGDVVRISGKKRDDLQSVMAKLREAELGIPLQFVNYRD
jgi:uncharacterized protein YajQ (UPF0234 family)